MSNVLQNKTKKFRQDLEKLNKDDLIEILREQDPEIIKQINRIEWVFKNKLNHLAWANGEPITERPMSNKELSLLIDEPFEIDNVLLEMGISAEQQRQIHIAKDPCVWAKNFLGAETRVYQTLILRDPSLRKVLRAGRRLGKTFSMAIYLLHYSYTHKDGRCLVIAPMKSHVELIYQEIIRLASKNEVVSNSIIRKVTSPQFMIQFSNGSTIRFFTSGMRSGGKSDVARGQEAHVIVLDEMDYMHADDLDALYAMLQKTAEDQPDKVLIGASTPTGRRERFWEWCRSDRFKEFWFPSYCFDPKTLITMADGSFKYINEINVGDQVLTEKGSRKVTRTFERQFNGNIYNIKTYGDTSDLLVTGEHPFSAVKKIRRQKDYNWDWIEAKEIEPIKKRNQNSGHLIRSIIDNEQIDATLDMMNLFADQLEVVDIDRVQLKKIDSIGRKFINNFPRYIKLSDNLANIIGWYLAEGHLEAKDKHCRYRVVGWTLHSEETDYIKEIQNSLDSLSLGQLNLTFRKDNKAVCLRLNNGPLALLLDYLVGRNSAQKELHPIIMKAHASFQKEILSAYAKGDGYKAKDQSIVFRTSSSKLAKQIQIVCTRVNGNYPSISISPEKVCFINKKYKQYRSNKSYSIQWQIDVKKNTLGKKKISESEYALLVKSVKEIEYSGLVYNFEVEDTNSYIANGLLVHNCNPFFSKEQEDEFREQYSEIGYRHEIEADWGEDAEGVYPRKFVDKAFIDPGWDYIPEVSSARNFYTIGVDWDKYGAGTNIVVVEVCADSYEDERFRNKARICYREEIQKSEYTLTKAVQRIIELNSIFQPKHIYVDRGYGEVQVELLHKHGVDNPMSGLKEKVKGVSFSETIDIRDPYTKQLVKKEIKPYMVDNLRQYLEREVLCISERDSEMYMQLISYVVLRTTQTGRPVFEAGGSAVDHAHDALMLALLAITENYSDLHRAKFASRTESFSNTFFIPQTKKEDEDDDKSSKPIASRADKLMPNKFGYGKSFRKRPNAPIKRRTF